MYRYFRLALLTCVSLLALIPSSLFADETPTPPYETKEFVHPSMPWRPIPLWFWNNTQITASALEQQLQQMVETDGYGGCAILPFGQGFRPEYLSDSYFSLYSLAIDKARSLGAHMSIYDEYGFPSGSMGAINGSGVTTFKNNHPEFTIKRLDKIEYRLTAGATFERTLSLQGKLMSLVARNSKTKEILPLRDYYDEETQKLTWTVPQESGWFVMVCQCVVDGDPNVDYLSQEAVSHFIRDTHEAYYSHFPNDFGQTVVSTFFDEPTMYRANGRMWTNDFNEQFERRYGFSPELLYPALWYDIGPSTAWARNLLFSLHSTLYSEGFMKTISDWAGQHGILATGHQDQEEIANPTSVAGDLMLVGKHLSMPGIDKIGNGRNTEDFYKVVSSSANCWDKTYVMSETFGAMGNIPVEQLYQVAIEQYTKGINHLIPHAVWYNDRDVTFLPELSWRNNLYNKELPAFNRFLSRLNYLLARPGRHVADVAMLYPIQTQYAGHYLDGPKGYYEGGVEVPGTDYPLVSHLLTDDLGIDFTYLHPEVVDDRCTVSGGQLHLNNPVNSEHFSVVVLPGVKVISLTNLQKIEQAWQEGVRVVFTTQLPEQAADGAEYDEAVKAIVDRMLNADANKAYFVATPTEETLAAVFDECHADRDVTFEGGRHPFNYLHKVVEGHDVYFFGNIDATSATNTIHLRQPHNGTSFSLLNPHTGACRPLEFTDGGFALTLRPNQSVFVVDNALLLNNGGSEEPIDTKPSYAIETRANIEQLSAGLCFSIAGEGNYYMWQFNVSNPSQPRLRPHRWLGGSASVLGEIDLSGGIIKVGEPFDVRIEVEEESYARTYINNVLVDERSGSFAFGRIGFRQAHDDAYGKTEIALFDDVAINVLSGDASRQVFYADFTTDNPFSEGIITGDGWLRVEGSMNRDVLSWLSEVPTGVAHTLVPSYREGGNYSYSLLGQRTTNCGANGIFVVNGKKVIK